MDDLTIDIGAINCSGTVTSASISASSSATLANIAQSGTVRHSGDASVDVTGAKTLALADSAIAQRVTTDTVTVTLPTAANAANARFIIENSGTALGSVGFTVALATGTDTIRGAGITPGAGKTYINTKATANPGDRVVLLCDGVDGYVIQEKRGIFVRQA